MGDVFVGSHVYVMYGFKTQNCFRIHYIIRKTVPFVDCPHTKQVHSECLQGSRLFQFL